MSHHTDNTPSPSAAGETPNYAVMYSCAVAELEASRKVEAVLREQVQHLKEELQAVRQRDQGGFHASQVLDPRPGSSGAAIAFSDAYAEAYMQEREYQNIRQEYHSLFFPTQNTTVYPLLEAFWQRAGGHKEWFGHRTAESLTLLLSRDERSVHKMCSYKSREEDRFVEHVLARLPRLETLCFGGLSYTLDPAELATVGPSAFAKLRAVDLSKSPFTGEQLRVLVEALPQVVHINVTGCGSLTWAEVQDTLHGRADVTVEPPTETLFVAAQQSQYADYLYKEFIFCDQTYSLGRLWTELRGREWRNRISPDMLTEVLRRSCIKRVRLAGVTENPTHDHVYIPSADLPVFFMDFVSRLPLVEVISIRSCSAWPFNWAALQSVERPFPALKQIALTHVPWQPEQLIEIAERIPTLEASEDWRNNGGAFDVHAVDGPDDIDVMALRRACGMKLYIWAK